MEVEYRANCKIGVAVSGGADSMALLDCYKKIGQDITVINFEHGLRGEESIKDSLFVADYCRRNNHECLRYDLDTLNEAEKTKESVELCARRLRYEVFDRLLKEKKVDYIALAHHADDNAETVLMRIMRGTGIKGLTGIADRDRFLHPLIKYSKKEIYEYVENNGIPYVTDSTNYLSDYTRNYLRNEIIPLLKERFGDITKVITRLSESAKETDDYLEKNAIAAKVEDGRYALENLSEQDKIICKYSVLKTLRALGCEQDIEQRHLDYVLSLLSAKDNTCIDLPFGVEALKIGSKLFFRKKKPFNTIEIPYQEDMSFVYDDIEYSFIGGEELIAGITVDGGKIPGGSVVRNWRDGDRFKKVNGSTKLLSDYFNEKKIDAWTKQTALVLAYGANVLAVLGIETADCVKIDENTTKIKHIKRRKV